MLDGAFPCAPRPAALPCTCHVSKCKVAFLQGPNPVGGGHRAGWSSPSLCTSHRAEQDGVRGWEKPRTADCGHALSSASCHCRRKVLDLSRGRMRSSAQGTSRADALRSCTVSKQSSAPDTKHRGKSHPTSVSPPHSVCRLLNGH